MTVVALHIDDVNETRNERDRVFVESIKYKIAQSGQKHQRQQYSKKMCVCVLCLYVSCRRRRRRCRSFHSSELRIQHAEHSLYSNRKPIE